MSDVLSSEKLRLACEEAALSHGLSVPAIEVLPGPGLHIASSGLKLHLGQGLSEMAPRQLQALLSFGLTFHEQLSDLSSGRLRNSNQAEVQGGRSRWLARGLPPRLIKSLNRYFAFRGPAPTHRSDLARSARLSAQSDFHGSPVALLQALLAYRLDMAHAAACDHFSPLFDDVAQLDDFAQQLETLMEGDFVDNPELVLPLANKVLRMAHRTAALIDIGDSNSSVQISGLNRLYESVGPVGSIAGMIAKLSSSALSDGERIDTLADLLCKATPVPTRLPLVDFAVSKLGHLSTPQKLTLMAQLRENLSASSETSVLAWTLFNVLRSRLIAGDEITAKRRVLTDKSKRSCIAELFYVASELAGMESSISARARRDQVDEVCNALDIDRPVSSPDEFQAAAWMEALDELSHFSLHETLTLLDALALWGRDNAPYQVWLSAICQRVRIQRQLAAGPIDKADRLTQYGEGQPNALQAVA